MKDFHPTFSIIYVAQAQLQCFMKPKETELMLKKKCEFSVLLQTATDRHAPTIYGITSNL